MYLGDSDDHASTLAPVWIESRGHRGPPRRAWTAGLGYAQKRSVSTTLIAALSGVDGVLEAPSNDSGAIGLDGYAGTGIKAPKVLFSHETRCRPSNGRSRRRAGGQFGIEPVARSAERNRNDVGIAGRGCGGAGALRVATVDNSVLRLVESVEQGTAATVGHSPGESRRLPSSQQVNSQSVHGKVVET